MSCASARPARRKIGSVLTTEAGSSVAANANGIIAVAHAHFAHCVKLYNSNFNLLATVTSFNGSNYDAPADVEVGEQSGNFYALDNGTTAFSSISGQSGSYGQILATYYYPTPPATIYRLPRLGKEQSLLSHQRLLTRACPPARLIVAIAVDRPSPPHWSLSLRPDRRLRLYGDALYGGVAVDTSGTLYTLGSGQTVINEWNSSGSASGSVTLSGTLDRYRAVCCV